MHRRARYELLVTDRPWMEARGRRVTAIRPDSVQALGLPWTSPGIYSPFTEELQAEPELRERRHPCAELQWVRWFASS